MTFPSFEGIASTRYCLCVFFVKNLFLHFPITNNCSFVFTVYKESISTRICIPGFRSTGTYETLKVSLYFVLSKVLVSLITFYSPFSFYFLSICVLYKAIEFLVQPTYVQLWSQGIHEILMQDRLRAAQVSFRPQEPRIVVSYSWDNPLQKNNLWTYGISIKDYAKDMRPITGKTRQPMPSRLWVLHHFAFSRHKLDFMRLATASSITTGKQWLQFVVTLTLYTEVQLNLASKRTRRFGV